jgi:hypothetical protein
MKPIELIQTASLKLLSIFKFSKEDFTENLRAKTPYL